jgi:GDP-mannose 4,6 dehydratase
MTVSSPGPGMRAVVTGGAGFLGSHLCERLLARSLHVVCLDNLITGSAANLSHLTAGPFFTLVDCDITRFFGIDGEVDYVFHLASPASPADYLRFPVQTLKAGSIGTINALEVARDKKARFVLASSSEVYGDPLEHPQPESYWGNVNPIGPRSPYDEAKRFAEAVAAAYSKTHSVGIAMRAWARTVPDIHLAVVTATVDELLRDLSGPQDVVLLGSSLRADPDPEANVRRLAGAGRRVLIIDGYQHGRAKPGGRRTWVPDP